MSLKLRLPNYLLLSAGKHFSNISGIKTFVEGAEERDLSGETDWIEIRIDGPNIGEVSKDLLLITSEINLLICTHMDIEAPFNHVTNVGKVANIFEDFYIYKYGSDSDEDDESVVGLFKLEPTDDLGEKIAICNMGQIDPSIKLLQTTIEGHFKMFVNKEQ